MKVKLSEIFVSLTDKEVYTVEELSSLALQSDFIRKIAAKFDLIFLEEVAEENNLCFAENTEVRPEYRNTFSKANIMEIVLPQLFGTAVNLQQSVVEFPKDAQSLFSKTYKDLIVIKAEKQHLRETMLELRNHMTREDRNRFSEGICKQLWDLILERKMQVIHSYLTMGSEVNILPLLQKALDNNIRVVVPKTLKNRQMQNLILTDLKNMETGIFNTYHPKDALEYSGKYDLIIVAGLAFDKRGFRVGYGGGYYDTFLADHNAVLEVGVCFPFQIVDCVPVEEHDVRLDKVIY